jgi:hypothetical protein
MNRAAGEKLKYFLLVPSVELSDRRRFITAKSAQGFSS